MIEYILIEAEEGVIGPASRYTSVWRFDNYDEAWKALLHRFHEFGGNGEVNEMYGNAYVDGPLMVWQIIGIPC